MRELLRGLAFGVVLAAASRASAEPGRGVWMSAEGQLVVEKRLRLGVEQQLRLEGPATDFDQTFTELSASYRLTSFLSLGAGYRFIVRADEQRHRGMADASLEHAFGPIELQYRLRGQITTRGDMEPQTVIRNRLSASVDAPYRLAPFAAGEVHHVVAPASELRELRGYLGVDWGVSKAIRLEVFYLYQREVNVNQPERNHILGLGMRYRARA